MILGLFESFGAEFFIKRPAVRNLQLDGLLTFSAFKHEKFGGLIKLTRYSEQMMKRSTDSWIKIRDLIHTLIQYLLQQNSFGTGKDVTIEKKEDVRRYAWDTPNHQFKPSCENRPLSSDQGSQRVCDDDIRCRSDVCVPWRESRSLEEVGVAHEPHFSSGREYTQSVRANVLRELKSKDLLFAKTAKQDMTAVSFNDHFRDRMGKKDRRHAEKFPQLWKLRP